VAILRILQLLLTALLVEKIGYLSKNPPIRPCRKVTDKHYYIMLYRAYLSINRNRTHNFSELLAWVDVNPTTTRSRRPLDNYWFTVSIN